MNEDQLQLPKRFSLMGADGKPYESPQAGTLAGNRKQKTYGLLNCGLPSCAFPDRGLPPNQPRIRVFFADEATAIAAGYRPCGACLPQRYQEWKNGPQEGIAYPWKNFPAPKPHPGRRSH